MDRLLKRAEKLQGHNRDLLGRIAHTEKELERVAKRIVNETSEVDDA